MASHCPSTDADQAHSRAAETLNVRLPPWAGTCPSPLTATEHREIGLGPVAVVVVAEEPHPAAPTKIARFSVRSGTSDDRLPIESVQLALQPCGCAPKLLPLPHGRTKEALA